MVTASDRLDILNLISRHSHALDGTDPQAYADVFASDGVLLERRQGKVSVLGRGSEELAAYMARLIEERGGGQPRHHVRNTIFVETSRDRAVTRTYFFVTLVPGAGQLAQVTDTGIYEDVLVRNPDGWRMERRVAAYD